MNPVAVTGLLVAAIRAEESARPDRLFEDPFASKLAGDAGREALARHREEGVGVPIIEVRTRWFDEGLARAWDGGVRQFVIVAAGMDARAYRLPWPGGTRVFELDQPDVLDAKAAALSGATPLCARVPLPTDLAGPWWDALAAAGFARDARTAWLVEGLLQYLERPAVERLFAKLDSLSAPGSICLYDMVGQSLLDAPFMAPMLERMRALGAPWIFGSDEPESFLPGWAVSRVNPAVPGNAWKRWPFPAPPVGAAEGPSGYFLEGIKGTS
ncbi:MAG TPA: SAM-dependent methyltransferase [Polyangiaceae bacterium]